MLGGDSAEKDLTYYYIGVGSKMRNKLEFRTEQSRKASQTRKFLFGFGLFFIIFAAVVILWFLKYIDYDLSNLFNTSEKTSDAMSDTLPEKDYEGFSYFLFCCADENKNNEQELRFTVLMKVDIGAKNISISAFSDSEMSSANGKTQTLEEHYRQGGINQLRNAVEKARDIEITAYVLSDDEGFDDAINALGSVTMDVPEQISYRSDEFNFICANGRKNFRGADLLKYLRYCRTKGHEGLKTQEEIFVAMIEQYMTSARAERADYYYGKIIDNVESDITVIVFADYKAYIEYLTADDGFTVWAAD